MLQLPAEEMRRPIGRVQSIAMLGATGCMTISVTLTYLVFFVGLQGMLVFRAITPKASVERECEERESRENEAQNQCESFKSKPYKRESRENSQGKVLRFQHAFQVGVYSILKARLSSYSLEGKVGGNILVKMFLLNYNCI